MSEEKKDIVNDAATMGTKIDCRCKTNNNVGIWIAILALVINSCTGFLPSMREHRMEENIAIHEGDVNRLYNHTYGMQEDIRQLEGRELSNEIFVRQAKSKIDVMDKSLTELVNQHKRKK